MTIVILCIFIKEINESQLKVKWSFWCDL